MIDHIVAIFSLQEPGSLQNDLEMIQEKSRKAEEAKRVIITNTISHGGRVIGQILGNEVVVVPADQVEIIKEIHEKLRSETSCPCTVGVGEDAHQALHALKYAQENAPNTIKVYTPEIEEEVARHPLEVAIGPDDDVRKSEKYRPIGDGDRQKILQTLATVQKNKEVFEQMKQQAPEVYAGLVSVIQSLTAMLQSDKEQENDHVNTMIEKINNHLHRYHNRHHEKLAQQIQKEIDKHYDKHEKEKREEREQYLKIAHQLHKERRQEAIAFAKKHGDVNHRFLHRLLVALKD